MSSEREEYTGIANGVNKVKAGVSDFVDHGHQGNRAPGGYNLRVLALKSEAFL